MEEGGDGATPESELLDINDENVPVIVSQLLSKEELQNKSLLQMFKVSTTPSDYKYKDVLKCMAALFFKQKYSGTLKSVLSIWLNAAAEKQQLEELNNDKEEEEEEENQIHKAHSVSDNDKKDDYFDQKDEKPAKPKKSEKKKESPKQTKHADNQDAAIKIEYDDGINAMPNASDDKQEIVVKMKEANSNANPDAPSIEDIVIMWSLMMFSHSLEVAEAQNREALQIFATAVEDLRIECGVLINGLISFIIENDPKANEEAVLEYNPSAHDSNAETLKWAYESMHQLLEQKPKEKEEYLVYIFNLLSIQYKCINQEQEIEMPENLFKALKDELFKSFKELMGDATIETMSAFSTDIEQNMIDNQEAHVDLE